jgi:hypothetical protein
MSTKVGVFIIESRKTVEEAKGKRQGLILKEILTLLGISTEYRYIRTLKELREMGRQYEDTRFRYLHLSMHGVTSNGEPVSKVALTLDQITYKTLHNAIKNKRTNDKRRLFLSACHVLDAIAEEFKPEEDSFISIVAPSTKIKTSVAPLVWATFYYEMFRIDKKSMTNKDIRHELDRICGFFNANFKGFFRTDGVERGYQAYSFPKRDNGGRP